MLTTASNKGGDSTRVASVGEPEGTRTYQAGEAEVRVRVAVPLLETTKPEHYEREENTSQLRSSRNKKRFP